MAILAAVCRSLALSFVTFHFSVVLLGMWHPYCRIAGTCGFPEPDGLHADRRRGIGLMKGLNRPWRALEEVREPLAILLGFVSSQRPYRVAAAVAA
jgi:hypothetical protein